MSFSHSIFDLVQKRCSHRTYQKRSLEPEHRASLIEAFGQPPAGPFGGRIRLQLHETRIADRPDGQKLGTYGVIRGAVDFLVGAIRRGARDLEDFGYGFEWAILKCTDIGLGTCWLGGTFQRTDFEKAILAQPDEVVPAVSPIGYPTQRRSLVDATIRFFAGSKDRHAWERLFFLGDFKTPLSLADTGPYSQLLEMVRLAPSASNKQPWRILRDREGARFHLFLQRSVGYNFFSVDLQRVDMGIAMAHLDLAARELGLVGEFRVESMGRMELPPRTSYVATWVCA